MDHKLRPSALILATGLWLGVLTDVLLRSTPWGINVLLWTMAALAGIHLILRAGRGEGLRKHAAIVAPILLFAALFAWRDSAVLKILDGTALFTLLGLLAARIRYEW